MKKEGEKQTGVGENREWGRGSEKKKTKKKGEKGVGRLGGEGTRGG